MTGALLWECMPTGIGRVVYGSRDYYNHEARGPGLAERFTFQGCHVCPFKDSLSFLGPVCP